MSLMLRSAARRIGLGPVVHALRKMDKRLNARPNPLMAARPRSTPARYLSTAAIFRNEGPNLAEWIEFHRLQGVEHIYLYDNGSTDNPGTVLEPYVREGFATIIPWAFPRMIFDIKAQRLAYIHAILNFGAKWRWMAFIDIDEFLFPVAGDSLTATLARYESLPAVAAYWTMYGFNGHASRPSGLTIENYTKRAPYGIEAAPKSVVDPSKVTGIASAHMFDFAEGRRIAYDEQKRLVGLRGEHGPSEILRLNHYFTRSREEFAAKVARLPHKSDERLRVAAKLDDGAFHDGTILRFVPELKRRLRTGCRMRSGIAIGAEAIAAGDLPVSTS